jgi:excinuclease ABC subunit C
LLNDLQITRTPMKRFIRRFEPNLKPMADMQQLGEMLGLSESPRIMECFDISNISTTHKVASMVCFKEGRPDRTHYRRYRIQGFEGQDDFASMAEVIRRRYQRVLSEGLRTPNLVIVDGGKGQLSAARRELIELGLNHLPIIGLAKENEEIFRPNDTAPLVLDKSTGALRLLQRIRDEAHRFANGYHQLLMKQRISESLLDDCPGVSAYRKKLLLQHFHSIERIKKASAVEIASVDGIGPKLASGIVEFFARKEKH